MGSDVPKHVAVIRVMTPIYQLCAQQTGCCLRVLLVQPHPCTQPSDLGGQDTLPSPEEFTAGVGVPVVFGQGIGRRERCIHSLCDCISGETCRRHPLKVGLVKPAVSRRN